MSRGIRRLGMLMPTFKIIRSTPLILTEKTAFTLTTILVSMKASIMETATTRRRKRQIPDTTSMERLTQFTPLQATPKVRSRDTAALLIQEDRWPDHLPRR